MVVEVADAQLIMEQPSKLRLCLMPRDGNDERRRVVAEPYVLPACDPQFTKGQLWTG